jgi:hypothetical protein
LRIGTEIKGCPKLGTKITPQNLKENNTKFRFFNKKKSIYLFIYNVKEFF